MKLTQRQAFNRLTKMANGAYATVEMYLSRYGRSYSGYISDVGIVKGRSFEDVVKKMAKKMSEYEARLNSETNARLL